jgi:hypothetical protein
MIDIIRYGNAPGLRAVIHFSWFKHTPNEAILSELEEVYGKDVMSLRGIEKRTAAFDGGRIEFADLPRSGKSRDTGEPDAGRALIEARDAYL